MIFWIEKDTEVSYDKFFKDIKKEKSSQSLLGYNYFLLLIIHLLRGYKPNSVEKIINYLFENKAGLNFLIDTSGTTSIPKSVKVNLSNCIRHVKKKDQNKNRVWGMGYPAGSFASTQVFFQSFINKETIIYLYGMNFNSSDKLFSRYNITNLTCTPTFLSMLLINLKKVYPVVKKITTGGEKMNSSLIQSFKKIFIEAEYINIYASTEAGSLLYSNSEFFSIPKKYKNRLKIENGVLKVHKSLLNGINQNIQDWYNTNDIVEFTDDNKFKFISRSNGHLNTGGFRVLPSEIEEIILTIKGVIDAHVYGKPNSLLGTVICADIIGKNINSKMIKTEMTNITEKHKIPQIIRIVKTFQHTSNGKKKLLI